MTVSFSNKGSNCKILKCRRERRKLRDESAVDAKDENRRGEVKETAKHRATEGGGEGESNMSVTVNTSLSGGVTLTQL